ncbi:hypothetical protein V6Z11_D07G112200 [Gossypium hirsutum]
MAAKYTSRKMKENEELLNIDNKTCKHECLTNNINGFDIKFLYFHLRNSISNNLNFHGSFKLIHFYILWQPKSHHKMATATFNPVPSIVLIFLLNILLSTDLKYPVIFNLHFHFFFLEPRKISLEDVSFGVLLPVDLSVEKS